MGNNQGRNNAPAVDAEAGVGAGAAPAANEPPADQAAVNVEMANIDGADGAPSVRTPTETHTTTLASLFALSKPSLKLTKGKEGFTVAFNFDASVDGIVDVYFLARPVTDPKAAVRFESAKGFCPPPFKFSKGMRQTYEMSTKHAVDLSEVAEEDLTKESGLEKYPLVIAIHTVPKEGSESDSDEGGEITTAKKTEYQCHTTYCRFEKAPEESYNAKVLKQIIRVDDCSYLLYEIFGIGKDADGQSECVVCMASPKDTTVLPCRHMCLCHRCARELRQRSNRCPICRVPFQSLLQFKVKKKGVRKEKKGKEEDAETETKTSESSS